MGATISSPKTFSIEEVWDTNDEVVFDDGSADPVSDYGISNYEVRLPFVFGVGASFTFPQVLISGDIEYL